jgi:hypothetical protein
MNLAVWWIALGIRVERIAPGEPTQNARHERMHRTLKAASTRPPAYNLEGHDSSPATVTSVGGPPPSSSAPPSRASGSDSTKSTTASGASSGVTLNSGAMTNVATPSTMAGDLGDLLRTPQTNDCHPCTQGLDQPVTYVPGCTRRRLVRRFHHWSVWFPTRRLPYGRDGDAPMCSANKIRQSKTMSRFL